MRVQRVRETQPWINDFIDEVVSFPNATHDDQVDAMSQALNRFRDHPVGKWLEALCTL